MNESFVADLLVPNKNEGQAVFPFVFLHQTTMRISRTMLSDQQAPLVPWESHEAERTTAAKLAAGQLGGER